MHRPVETSLEWLLLSCLSEPQVALLFVFCSPRAAGSFYLSYNTNRMSDSSMTASANSFFEENKGLVLGGTAAAALLVFFIIGTIIVVRKRRHTFADEEAPKYENEPDALPKYKKGSNASDSTKPTLQLVKEGKMNPDALRDDWRNGTLRDQLANKAVEEGSTFLIGKARSMLTQKRQQSTGGRR